MGRVSSESEGTVYPDSESFLESFNDEESVLDGPPRLVAAKRESGSGPSAAPRPRSTLHSPGVRVS